MLVWFKGQGFINFVLPKSSFLVFLKFMLCMLLYINIEV